MGLGFALSLLARRNEIYRPFLALGYIVVFLISAAAAWAPQYLYTGSVAPKTGLLNLQTMWGIVLLKFATIVNSAGEAQALLFPNPWCVGPLLHANAWEWYVAHPLAGLATVAGHVFAEFSFEYPFVYVYNLDLIFAFSSGADVVHRRGRSSQREFSALRP